MNMCMVNEQEDIDKLEHQILCATTFTQLSKALLSINKSITERKKRLAYSGNLTDVSIIEIEGEISALETLSDVGKAMIKEVQQNAYTEHKINYEFRKIVRDNAKKEDYAKWLKEAKEK